MGFSSELYANEPIIDDESSSDLEAPPSGESTGLMLPMSHSAEGGNYGDLASAFPQKLLIPESDWQGIIQDKEERKDRISDYITKYKVPCKSQAKTNYCWIFGPVGAVEVVRLFQNHEYVDLSPASCGSKIKNFRNDGGYGPEGLRYIVEHGIVPSSMWPAAAIQRKYDTPEAWVEADKYRVTEWMELRPRNMEQVVSCLLRNIPVTVGLSWWGHQVYYADAVWLDGEIAVRPRNSWGPGWGTDGFSILRGSKMVPDDAVAPRVAMAA